MRAISIIAAGASVLSAAVSAAEINVISTQATQEAYLELVAQFEKASGHRLKIEYGSTGPLKAQIEKGQPFDVAIVGVETIDELLKSGKLASGSRVDIARSGMGIAIRKGAPKPELGTTQAFKQALLKAQTIAYSEGGLTGIYIKGLVERLGIAEELKSKIRSGRGAEMVGEGKAEIGLTQVSEILPVAGAELAGPLPPEVQQYTVFPAALSAAVIQAEAGQALLKFLKSPGAAKVLKAKGLEPAA